MKTTLSTTATSNNGWDVITAVSNSGLSSLVKRLIPQSFQLTVDNVAYDISCQPETATGQIINIQNLISVTFPVEGIPSSGSSSADDFSGDVTVQFDAFQVAMNRVSNLNSLMLDGTTGYMVANSSGTFKSSTGFTIEAWVRTKVDGENQTIVSYGQSPNPGIIFTITDDSKLSLWLSTGSLESSSLENSNLWDGNWHHVAVSSTNNVISFYLDGFMWGSGNSPTTNSLGGNPFTIGSINNLTFFNGSITDVRVWNVGRTQEQIQQCMNVNFEDVPSDQRTGLIELWNFGSGFPQPINVINNEVGSLEGGAEVDQNITVTPDVYVNILSPDIQLEVTNELTGVNEADFNSSLTALINTSLIPYAQLVKPGFGFQHSYQPTFGNFITAPSGSSNYNTQLLALSMIDNRLSPSGDQNSLFANATSILVPDNDQNMNISISYSDYIVLKTQQNLLFKRPTFNSGNLSLSNTNNQWILELTKSAGRFPFSWWSYYQTQITYDTGITNSRIQNVPWATVSSTSTKKYSPQSRTSNSPIQNIDVTTAVTDSSGTYNTYWLIFIMLILFAIGIAIGFMAFGPIGAIIGWFISLIIFMILVVIDVTFIAPSTAARRKKLLEAAEPSIPNNNPSLTILHYLYNQAQIMQGILTAPSYVMDLSPSVIYYDIEAILDIGLINNTGADITLSTSTSDPSIMSITLPDFPDLDLTSMSIELQGWSYTLEDNVLTLTNLSQDTWKSGKSNAISFGIQGVVSLAQQPPTGSGFVTVNITTMSIGVPPMSGRLSYKQKSPSYNILNWEALNPTDNGFSNWADMTGQPVTSGSKNVSSQAQGFIPLATANQLISQGPNTGDIVNWQLGYSNIAKGCVAMMQPDQGASSSAPYGTSPGSGDTSLVYFGPSQSNAGFSITYPKTE